VLALATEPSWELDHPLRSPESDDPSREEHPPAVTDPGIVHSEHPDRMSQCEPVYRTAGYDERFDVGRHCMDAQQCIEEGLGRNASVRPTTCLDAGLTHVRTLRPDGALDQGVVSRRSAGLRRRGRSLRRR
jgi:hypothetical protein